MSTPHDTIVALAEAFPSCFAMFQKRRKPLKLGIHNDVIGALAGTITAKELSVAMRVYCGNRFYLKACIEGAPRIDLNGEAARPRQCRRSRQCQAAIRTAAR
jgi:ProP effector